MSLTTRAFACALILLLGPIRAGTIESTGQSSAAQQQPKFRASIDLVPLDVRVLDGSGRPVKDLKQSDFTIREDGQPQTIRHFSMHEFTPDHSLTRIEPSLRTAQTEDLAPDNRRVFLFVLGRGRHQAVSKYVDALAGFAGRALPQDRIAVFAWNRATDFTTDHELVRRVLVRYRDEHERIEAALRQHFSGLQAIYGSKEIPAHIQKVIDNVFRDADAVRPRPLAPASVVDSQRIDQETRQTASALQRNQEIQDKLAAGFKTLPDLSAEIAASLTDLTFEEYIEKMTETMQDVGNLYAGIGYLRFLAGEKHLVFMTQNGVSLPDQQQNGSLARVAADARIALDFVQTGGTVGAPPPRIVPGQGVVMYPVATTNQVFAQSFAMQDLRLMADRTGGQAMMFRSGDDAFRRLETGMSFEYLLGYSPSNVVLDGKFRKIVVRVNRPGVRVFVREGYLATPAPVALDRREMITFSRVRAAAEYGSIVDHLKVRLASIAASATELSLDVTVDVSRVRFLEEKDRHTTVLDVSLFCGGENDQQVGHASRRVELSMNEAQFARAKQQGVTFRLTAPLTSPARNVKVVVYNYSADLVGSQVSQVRR